jgi:hypothetical protein
MTRVLVVSHDIDLADQEVDSLRRLGYDVEECGGPVRGRCPVLAGQPCAMADRADVLVYDAWATGEPEGAQRLIEGLRDLHPDIPLVLCSSGFEPNWIEIAGPHRVTPLVGRPSGARLREAIDQALETAARSSPTTAV